MTTWTLIVYNLRNLTTLTKSYFAILADVSYTFVGLLALITKLRSSIVPLKHMIFSTLIDFVSLQGILEFAHYLF
jgi:hypothetical protein